MESAELSSPRVTSDGVGSESGSSAYAVGGAHVFHSTPEEESVRPILHRRDSQLATLAILDPVYHSESFYCLKSDEFLFTDKSKNGFFSMLRTISQQQTIGATITSR